MIRSSFFVTLCLLRTCCDGKIFHIGVVAPWKIGYSVGSHSAGAILMALDDIRSDNITFSEIHKAGHFFSFQWKDTQCNPNVGLPLIAELIFANGSIERSVDAFFGPCCSIVCEPGGNLARHWKKPMISFGCASLRLSDKSIYRTFARTYGSGHYDRANLYLMQMFRYETIAIFTSHDDLFSARAASIRALLTESGINVKHYLYFGGSTGKKSNLRRDLEKVMETCND
jgi:hypothetical protein